MNALAPELVLVSTVAAVGVLHTIVPDHWVPITLIARAKHWSRLETAKAALIAGTGHTVSTLIIGLIVWIAGLAFAARFGNLVSIVSSVALVAFGCWIAIGSWLELRYGHHHDHDHQQGQSQRATLLLILGSSPMVEGIPAFFAAAKYGPALIALMSCVFAAATIATYVVLCTYSSAGLQKLRLGNLEEYGEVLSGGFIALVGLVFLVWPVL